MKFTKMHGIGNDFVVIDCFNNTVENPVEMAGKLLDRRFGIGGDGLIFAMPSEVADARMRIFNSDTSEAEMCGNGIRCMGKFVYDNGLCRKNPMTVETLAGILTLNFELEDGKVACVTVDMGKPRLVPEEIPVASESNRVKIDLGNREAEFFCASTGVPHAVTFDYYPEGEEFLRLGAMMEKHPVFPRKTNVEFCRVDPEGGIDVRVWERGDGPTLACGTGACAVLTAASSMGLCGRESVIHLPGGDLFIRWAEDDHLFMTGPAAVSFTGETDLI